MRSLVALAALCLLPGKLYALDVMLDARITVADGVVISAVTNLPESTRITVAVSCESSGYHARGDTVVSGGRFRSGPFTDQGQALPPGTCLSEIITEPAVFQPDSVQRVIGEKGEKMQGPMILRGMMGSRVYLSAQFTLL